MIVPERKTLNDKEMFDDIVRAVLSVMGDDAVRIILYGSVARGDNTPESDVDIAVLSKKNYGWQEMMRLDDIIAPLDLKHSTLFSLRVVEEKYFDEWKHAPGLYSSVNKEGVTLWKSAG